VVFIPTSFFVSNIFDGLIWFLLPCALVIINDIGAYLVGARAPTGLNVGSGVRFWGGARGRVRGRDGVRVRVQTASHLAAREAMAANYSMSTLICC